MKKDYAPPRARALAATARLKAMPVLLEQGKVNLVRPVALYAKLTIDSARAIDPLFTGSLMTLASGLKKNERNELVKARDAALVSVHGFADWLENRLPQMVAFKPMGEANYNELLRRSYLLPLDARQVEMLGQAELARYRALEALLPDPAMADPDPARSRVVPKGQDDFLKAYEMIRFLKEKNLLTLPESLGHFSIRQLPAAFKPTSPGGFMNPPGIYDSDPGGFYFIPTYDPKSANFYIRAAIEDPRPILGHEGIPGHFLQLSIANHLPDEIRRQHGDGVFIEGWALYTEEMLSRTGLYPDGSAAQGQVLRLSRYRAARIGVDVNLDLRTSGEVLHGGRRARPRGGRGRGGGRRLRPDPEDHLYGWQVADHAAARSLPRAQGERLPSWRLPRRFVEERQPAPVDRRVDSPRRRRHPRASGAFERRALKDLSSTARSPWRRDSEGAVPAGVRCRRGATLG